MNYLKKYSILQHKLFAVFLCISVDRVVLDHTPRRFGSGTSKL